MKIAIIGASGFVGTPLLEEALARGHQVTAVTRHPEKVPANKNMKAVKADVNNENELAHALEGVEAVISSVHFSQSDIGKILGAVKKAHVPRLLVVGGAGSLQVANGMALYDTPEFPEAYKVEAKAGGKFLENLRKEKEVKWTFLSPSAEFTAQKRTGTFRLGDEKLLLDKNGRSHISVQDYAIAMINELEKPEHIQKRFTVGY
jgi:putative NADH-flavin reductase